MNTNIMSAAIAHLHTVGCPGRASAMRAALRAIQQVDLDEECALVGALVALQDVLKDASSSLAPGLREPLARALTELEDVLDATL